MASTTLPPVPYQTPMFQDGGTMTAPWTAWFRETFSRVQSLTPGAGSVSYPIALTLGGTGKTTALAAFNNLSPLSAKGDIAVHNGTNNIRFPVGSNGQVVVADSTQASGLNYSGVPWTAYTPIFAAGFGTVTGASFKYSYFNKTVHVIGQFTSGTMSDSTFAISLPSTYTGSSLLSAGDLVGKWAHSAVAGAKALFMGCDANASTVNFYQQSVDSGGLGTGYSKIVTAAGMPAASTTYYVNFSVPVNQ